jgi:hypothetical protein
MMGIMVPETCWTNNTFCNKKPICCIQLAFYFHVLTTIHAQTHIKCITKIIQCYPRESLYHVKNLETAI